MNVLVPKILLSPNAAEISVPTSLFLRIALVHMRIRYEASFTIFLRSNACCGRGTRQI
jgi:hypothetical protein